MFDDRVKYTLIYKDQIWTLSEPINWRDDTVEYVRHRDYHGIFSEISTTLEFTNYSALFIREIYQKDGINAEITLKKEVRHPQTDRWELDYSGVLDLSEYEFSNKTVKVKINSSGLLSLLKSRQNEKVEIDRLDSLDGLELPALETKILGLEGRRILLISQDGNIENEQFSNTKLYNIRGLNQTPTLKSSILMNLVSQSDEDFHAIYEESSNIIYGDPISIIKSWSTPTTNQMFYADSPSEKTLKIRFKLKQQISLPNQTTYIVDLKIRIYKYSNGVTYDNETLMHTFFEGQLTSETPLLIDIDNEVDIDIIIGDSLTIVYEMKYTADETISENYQRELNSITDTIMLTVTENSYYPSSTTKTIMAHELGERLTKIIGGKRFYSDLLGRTDINYQTDGIAGLTALVHGHWIRQFPEDDDLFKKFTTSFKDYYESLDAIFCIGATVEKKGTLETLRIENRDYFYQKFVGIKLGKVANLSRKVAKDLHYSSIDVGYDKPSGDNLYEEAMGLDEYNTSTTLTTAISRFENPLTIKSNYRADSYGIEFARRKPKENYPTEDTRYDKEIFVIDVEKTLGANLRVSKWEDDLDYQPTGVFSPDTAFNLMFTPMRIIQRHASYIKAGLKKYYDSLLRYASSQGNSNMTTVKDGVSLQENGNLPINELKLARYGAEWVEFEYPLTWEIKQQLRGKTNGIPNVYGLVEFINEFGKKEKGYLFEVKGNNFKILV